MPAQSPEFALREMRSEVNTFVRFLNERKVIDNAGATYSIGDSLNESKTVNGNLYWKYKSGKVSLRLATGSVVCPVDTKSLSCSIDASVEGEISGKAQELKWAITKTEVDVE